MKQFIDKFMEYPKEQLIVDLVAWTLCLAFEAYLFFYGPASAMPIEARIVVFALLFLLALSEARKWKARRLKKKLDSNKQ